MIKTNLKRRSKNEKNESFAKEDANNALQTIISETANLKEIRITKDDNYDDDQKYYAFTVTIVAPPTVSERVYGLLKQRGLEFQFCDYMEEGLIKLLESKERLHPFGEKTEDILKGAIEKIKSIRSTLPKD